MQSEFEKERRHELEMQKREQEALDAERAAQERAKSAAVLSANVEELASIDSTFTALQQEWSALSSTLASSAYAAIIDATGTNLLRRTSTTFRKAAAAKGDCEAAVHGSTTKEHRARTIGTFQGLVSAAEGELDEIREYKKRLDSHSGRRPMADDPRGTRTANRPISRLQPESAVLLKNLESDEWLCRDKYDADFIFVADFCEMLEDRRDGLKRGVSVDGAFYQANGKTKSITFNGALAEVPFATWAP